MRSCRSRVASLVSIPVHALCEVDVLDGIESSTSWSVPSEPKWSVGVIPSFCCTAIYKTSCPMLSNSFQKFVKQHITSDWVKPHAGRDKFPSFTRALICVPMAQIASQTARP